MISRPSSTALIHFISFRVRDNLLKGTLFPARFGEPTEFSQLAMTVIENQYLNGSGTSIFRSLALLSLSRSLTPPPSPVLRIDGGSRMAKF